MNQDELNFISWCVDSSLNSDEEPLLHAAWMRATEIKQAELDRLMLEYCPQEMEPEQISNWYKHQALAK